MNDQFRQALADLLNKRSAALMPPGQSQPQQPGAAPAAMPWSEQVAAKFVGNPADRIAGIKKLWGL